MARYWSKVVNFSYPLAFGAPVRGGVPSEYRHPVWHGKTRMAWLPDSEKNSKTSLFVLTQLTNVTDRHTDRQTPHDGIGRAYASHRAAKMNASSRPRRGDGIRYLPLCLLVTSSIILDRIKTTPHQKMAHMPDLGTTQCPGRICRTAAPVMHITDLLHPLSRSADHSLDA